MSTQQTVAVLGLGRMGTAMVGRLREKGRKVTGWTRSRPGTAQSAVAEADVVVLSLYDGAACEEVLAQIGGSTDAVIVNTCTIGPREAATLAHRYGDAYVHAPVLGSIPAVASGSLQILAAGTALPIVRPVLEHLGTVIHINDAETAAALKLVANHSLAGAVLALRDALQQADAVGLRRDQTLDVLTHGQLGGLVERKRDVLMGHDAQAQFTAGALAKDLALLAEASGLPIPAAAEFGKASADLDIASVATAPAVDPAVLEPLRAYARGHATGDPIHFRRAFLPSAHIEGIRDGDFVSWPLEEYVALFDSTPATDELTRRRRVDSVEVHGSVATASMTLHHGATTFTDSFLIVRVDDGWKIANKVYHRHDPIDPPRVRPPEPVVVSR